MSKLARQLIEENLKTKAPVLDLGNCGLDGSEKALYFPLTQANHIETLILSNDWFELEKNKWIRKISQNRGYRNCLIQVPAALPKKLKTLILFGGLPPKRRIQDFSFLKGLTQLKHLNLGGNYIQDYTFLAGLTQLKHLDLSKNQIQDISLDFLNAFSELKELKLQDNPIQNIPTEIYNKWDNVLHDIRHYLEDLTKGATQNNEVKVILIGNGSVGKTKIARRLAEKDEFAFDTEHHSTHAISLLQCSIDCDFMPKGLQFNLWDFGGQDLYHATHRLFMQTRALFLLVWDIGNENKEHHEWEGRKYKNENLHYWLEYATFFGKDSPILVIQNKVDTEEQEEPGIPGPEQQALKKDFPNVTDFWQVSAKTGYNFEQLEYLIGEVFENNDSLRQELIDKKLPEAWVQVRNKVRSE